MNSQNLHCIKCNSNNVICELDEDDDMIMNIFCNNCFLIESIKFGTKSWAGLTYLLMPKSVKDVSKKSWIIHVLSVGLVKKEGNTTYLHSSGSNFMYQDCIK